MVAGAGGGEGAVSKVCGQWSDVVWREYGERARCCAADAAAYCSLLSTRAPRRNLREAPARDATDSVVGSEQRVGSASRTQRGRVMEEHCTHAIALLPNFARLAK